MRFLQENIFLVVLIVVVVVIGGILMVMSLSAAGDVADKIARRSELSSRLQRLQTARVNREVVNAERVRVEAVRAGAEEVARASVEWNRRNYPVITMSANNDLVPAFPIDPEKYKQYGLNYVFTQKYIAAMQKLLAELKLTRLPTQEELEDEAVQWQRKLERIHERRQRLSTKDKDRETPQPKTGIPTEPGRPWGGRPPTGGSDKEQSSTFRAQQIATTTLKVRKAHQGLMYLSDNALDMVFPIPMANTTPSQLWRAQVNLWVTSDILVAIGQTNQQVLRSAGAEIKKETVLNAAVKRLVKIDVEDDYFTTGGGTGETSSVRKARDYEGGATMPPGAMPPGMAPPGAGRKKAPQRNTTRKDRQQTQTVLADNLSQRVSCKEYDVVHYSFTVIMPAKYLSILQTNLLRRNYHTVLEVELSRVEEPADSLYYYGTDSVMQVRIKGELLLLAAWERGTWDRDTNSWSQAFPPLMPAAVLEEQFSESALRQEDLKRTQP
ncbi:MAG: hypothetical protein SVT52_09365 [Planctomycetota bacterium]|nr:hypothetical protein [Planctomycetota bacterium]